MDDLVLVAVDPTGRRLEWRLTEPEYLVGRGEGPGRLTVSGDPHLSRQQFKITRKGQGLVVERCPKTRNPLLFRSEVHDRFELTPGEGFLAGKTTFSLVGERAYALGEAARERARLRRIEDCFGAVVGLLRAWRLDAGGSQPWRTTFPVLRRVVPELRGLAFIRLHPDYEILSETQLLVPLRRELLERTFEEGSTVTYVSEDRSALPSDSGTLSAQVTWTVACPLRVLETRFVLCAFGASYFEDPERLEEVAAVVDVVGEMVGHHLAVERAAEYGSLLGVFGHHVGTLFKTSGALSLWSESEGRTRRVLDNLLPIWGISQAISLHKKQGEKEWAELLATWVDPGGAEAADLEGRVAASLRALVGYVHQGEEPPFLSWSLDGEPLTGGRLASLPPLADNPVLFDKTLALTIGLVELLTNLRKYPEPRGSGREDRRELAELHPAERRVEIFVRGEDGEAVVEVIQPVVTDPGGGIPRSRSLERIRSLEVALLRGLVETGQCERVGKTSLPHVVRTRQRWVYRWGRLLGEWRSLRGPQTAPAPGG